MNRTLRTVSFEFSATCHLLIAGSINQYSSLFILDTGANYTCIDLQRAKKMCLLIENSDELAGGLGRLDIEKSETIIDRLYIGDILLSSRPVAVIDLSYISAAIQPLGSLPIDGVIGNDILKQFDAVIDYGKMCLCLHV